jgi:hypothetical protein
MSGPLGSYAIVITWIFKSVTSFASMVIFAHISATLLGYRGALGRHL